MPFQGMFPLNGLLGMQAGIWLKVDQSIFPSCWDQKIILSAYHWLFNGEKDPIPGFCLLTKVMVPEENSYVF